MASMSLWLKAARSFTLLELLVVTAIISVLAALLVPTLSQMKERAHRIQCLSNLRQIGIGARQYANDHEGQFPLQIGGGNLPADHCRLMSNYLQNIGQIFKCPSGIKTATNNLSTIANSNISFCYVEDVSLQSLVEMPFMFDQGIPIPPVGTLSLYLGQRWQTGSVPNSNHKNDGGNIVFSDSRVEFKSVFPTSYGGGSSPNVRDPGP